MKEDRWRARAKYHPACSNRGGCHSKGQAELRRWRWPVRRRICSGAQINGRCDCCIEDSYSSREANAGFSSSMQAREALC